MQNCYMLNSAPEKLKRPELIKTVLERLPETRAILFAEHKKVPEEF